jgi:hypothetical protein
MDILQGKAIHQKMTRRFQELVTFFLNPFHLQLNIDHDYGYRKKHPQANKENKSRMSHEILCRFVSKTLVIGMREKKILLYLKWFKSLVKGVSHKCMHI